MSLNNNKLRSKLKSVLLANVFYIGPICVKPQTGEIIVDGNTHVLEPKVMDLLIALCECKNTIVSAENLFERVWPHSIYSPNSVRRNIALLRKLLSDEDKSLIKTHPKRGYSLQANITFEQPDTPKSAIKETTHKPKMHRISLSVIFALTGVLSLLLYYWHMHSGANITLDNVKPITSSSELEHYMRVSLDDRYMAIVRSHSEKDTEKHIVIKDLKLNRTWQVSTLSKPYRYLAWSNTHTLLYSTLNGNQVEFGKIILDEQYQHAHQETLLVRGDINWSSPFFVDHANNLLYLANQNASEHSRNVSLYKHSLNSGVVTTLLAPNDEFKPYKISLSDDKSTLALVGFNKQSKSVVKLLNLNTLQQQQIAELNHDWYFLTWHANTGSFLLSNGSQLSQLTIDGHWSMLPYSNFHFLQYIQSVNKKLYFIENRIDEDVYIASRNDFMQSQEIANSNGADWGAVLSPDESKVAYISTRNGFSQLFMKQLGSAMETLVFENSAKELAIAPPIWRNNHQLISALNNRPFLLEISESGTRVAWLENIIGVPLAWLNEGNAIVYMDKSAQGDTLYEYNLTSAKSKSLNVHLQNQQLAVSNQDQLIIVANKAIHNISTKTTLINTTGSNLRLYATQSGIYYRVKDINGYNLGFYDYNSGITQLPQPQDEFCELYCSQLDGISNSYYLLTKKQQQSDILSLDVN